MPEGGKHKCAAQLPDHLFFKQVLRDKTLAGPSSRTPSSLQKQASIGGKKSQVVYTYARTGNLRQATRQHCAP